MNRRPLESSWVKAAAYRPTPPEHLGALPKGCRGFLVVELARRGASAPAFYALPVPSWAAGAITGQSRQGGSVGRLVGRLMQGHSVRLEEWPADIPHEPEAITWTAGDCEPGQRNGREGDD